MGLRGGGEGLSHRAQALSLHAQSVDTGLPTLFIC